MIFAGGKILPDSELNPVLGCLEEEIVHTLSGPPLERETVLSALDALGRELDSGALDPLIAQYARRGPGRSWSGSAPRSAARPWRPGWSWSWAVSAAPGPLAAQR